MPRPLLYVILAFFCCACPFVEAAGQTISAGAVKGSISACAGTASTSPNIQQFTVTGTRLTGDVTANAPSNFEVSLSVNGVYGNTVNLPQAGGLANAVVYVRAAAIAPVGLISGVVSLSSPAAAPQTVAVSGMISAVPNINPVPNQAAVVSGAATAPINFTGTGNGYSWTIDNPNIGLAASGKGNIPSFTAINNGNTAITANVTVTPVPLTYAFTANSNDHTIAVINTEAATVAKVISVNNNPDKTIVTPDGKWVYVKYFNGNTITPIDASTYTVKPYILTGKGPAGMEMTPDGSKIFLTHTIPAAVSVISTADNTVSTTIPIGASPKLSAISPDGKHLYVAYNGNGDITVINTATNSAESTIAGSGSVSFITSSPDSKKLYVIYSGSVVEINAATNLPTNIPAAGNTAISLSVSPDGSKLYTVNQYSSSITAINTADRSLIANIPVGTYAVAAILGKNGDFLYTVNYGAHSISIIKTEDNTVVKELVLAGSLYTLSISPDGKYIFIPDQASDVVWQLNTATNTAVTIATTGVNPVLFNSSISNNSGCAGAPVSFTITVNPAPPTIVATGTLQAVSTDYGSSSQARTFTVKGSNLSDPLIVNPPAGFEVSTDGVNFSATLTLANNSGVLAPATVYIRLTKTANAATYFGNIVLSSTGAANVTVAMPNSVVRPVQIDIDLQIHKEYGDPLDDFTARYDTPNFTFDDHGGFKNGNTFESVKITFDNSVKPVDAKAGTYKGALIPSALTGRNGFIPGNYVPNYKFGDVEIIPAPLVITATKVIKPYGTALTNVAASKEFTFVALKNGETIGSVQINYGAGSAATAPVGVYPASIVALNATGGTFNPANYKITYEKGDIIVAAAPSPVLSATGTLTPVSTVYGDASDSRSFNISGSGIVQAVTVNPPDGFVISLDDRNFAGSIVIGSGPDMASRPIYIRLAATTNAGSYGGDVAISSGTTTIYITMPASTVSKAPLTLTASNETKSYGTELTTYTGTAKYNITTGTLKNRNTITALTLTYGAGRQAIDGVNTYPGSVQITGVAGANGFLEGNYNINAINADLIVSPARLTIRANTVTKIYGTTVAGSAASTDFVATGLQNGQTISSITTTYGSGAANTAWAGNYPASVTPSAPVGTFIASNYEITPLSAEIVVTPATLTVKAGDQIRAFGTNNPAFTYTYSGFVNNDTETQITYAPTLTTTATIQAAPGNYPIKASGAQAANYTFVYVDGVLTVSPPPLIIPPNAFTPNGDGINDTWLIPGLAGYKNCTVNIYNRLGQAVYTSVGYLSAWDGTYKGQNVAVGTYYYVIDTKNAVKLLSGNITIIR